MLNNVLDFVPKLPIAEKTKDATEWITEKFSFLFDPIKEHFGSFMESTSEFLISVPPVIIILLVAVIAFFISGKKFGLATFSIVGLWFIYNQELWEHLMSTFTLVLLASILSVIIGVPVGILMSKSRIASAIITPILDFMQTMPAFVYLIPAVAFFGIGMVPGVFASLIFATPPTVRFTNLGIRQVSQELVEASEAFGSTGAQKLFKVELPMAKTTIMAGINQTVMLALSMVVIASMIGAPGLGREVLSALQRAQVGTGFVAGVGIVILAIIIDRITQNMNKQKQ
ncbi:MAG: ABC transporter permease [Bacillota bacterium]|uniref:Proline/glycine betaine ABC transporter permease n=1 Tax=Virgibacillus salarius TaxID=447199 RepID=A0A941DWQ0_9BACI|nr:MULTISPECIES: proline/glycine betaine ABC transporter permease [Bacillaceae]NAZ09785.1 ABC transporter permease subunit [Agaribacter marinus]MBR7797076.1 proline/glycine betaine ABC transporter permease [Virgibacillus salarius]MCC2251925.1 proline/glycine betaine ABC transporter permease [Virgibacillus sp. AGTR]MDY7044917.1 proline/glycine betaine ABC transporter permease [Virgibacillus sp. M23]QRZ16463.1 proline/glycine betaine ABC transporter permease [Virgibacillus sp. AGTR]